MSVLSRNSTPDIQVPQMVEETAWGVLPDGGHERIHQMMAEHPDTDWSKARKLTLHLWYQSIRDQLGKTVIPFGTDPTQMHLLREAGHLSHTVDTDAEAEKLALDSWLTQWATDVESQRMGTYMAAAAVAPYRCPVCQVAGSKQPNEIRCPRCEAVRTQVLAEAQRDVVRPDGTTVVEHLRAELTKQAQAGSFAY